MDIRRLTRENEFYMGYPTKIQLISRKNGNQWYVNFPNALGETEECRINKVFTNGTEKYFQKERA